jgi:hypothetical protein
MGQITVDLGGGQSARKHVSRICGDHLNLARLTVESWAAAAIKDLKAGGDGQDVRRVAEVGLKQARHAGLMTAGAMQLFISAIAIGRKCAVADFVPS